MDIEGNWRRVKAYQGRLSEQERKGIAIVLFPDREDWLDEKLRHREDEALAIDFLCYLGQNGSVKAVRILLRQLEAREEAIQVAAAEALKLCPPAYAWEPLKQILLRQGKGAVKAGEVLMSYGDRGADALWKMYFEGNPPTGLKMQILQLLGEALDERAESLAFLAFLSEEDELIQAALTVAEKVDARVLWGNVTGCLKHPGWRQRGRAARLLGRWRENRALLYLHRMGSDPDNWVEEERQKAIQLMETAAGRS